VLTAALTEGPYFVDERLNRSDITSDPTDGSVKEGVPLALNLTVSTVDGVACTPLVGALVDMWHCDALGVYSDVSGAGQPDTTGQKFLRGYQITNDSGQVEFQTIYPGWYSGRTIHIHFKVRTDPDSQQGLKFTSQLFFDETITNAVIAREPYSQKGTPDTSNAADNIYQPDLVLPLAADGDGYAAAFHIGVSPA
jgi:protocatechuate 3,4-dioxygenase beta subunit